MAPKTKTDEKVDFWQKLAGMSEDDLHNVEVLIHRVFPEADLKTGYPIDGHCKTVKASSVTMESVNELVGGGTYRLQARALDTKLFCAHTTVKFPGIPKVVLPGSDQGAKTPSPTPAPPDREGSSRGSYEAGRRAGAEQARREHELADIKATVARLENAPVSSGQGNGKLVNTLLDAVIKMNAGGNGQPLSLTEALKLIREAREDGKSTAREIAEAIAEYSPGEDGDAAVQKELVKTLGKLLDKRQDAKRFDKAAEKVKKSDQPAAQMLVAIRDGIADMIDKEFPEFGRTAAQTVRGARSLQELMSAIHQVIAYLGEQLRDEGNVDENEEPGEPGSGEKADPKK